jgi:Protein of unknown function (DUF1189)
MKTPGRIAALWMSFYSADLYRAVGTEWRGIGVLYLVLLLTLSWLPSPIRWFYGIQTFMAAGADQFVRQMPVVTIENGVMRADPPGRHEIRDPDAKPGELGEFVVVIDDTIDEVPPQADTDTIALTRREFGSVRPSRSERRVWTLTPAADMVVTPDDAMSFLQAIAVLAPPVGYAAALLGSLVMRLAQLLIYGGIGVLLSRSRGPGIGYAAALRLAAVAMTPWIVIRTLLWFGPWEPAWFFRWPVAIAVTLAYLAFGIRAMEDK